MTEQEQTREDLSETRACRLSHGAPTPPRSCLARPPRTCPRSLSCGRSGTRASPPSRCDPIQPQTCPAGPSERRTCLRSQPCSLTGGDR